MKNLNKFVIAMAVLSCGTVIASAAQAEPLATAWYLAPSVNVMHVDNDFNSANTAAGIGMRFGAVVTPMLDVQFGPTFSRTGTSGGRYSQGTVGGDALYMFSRNKFRPFVLVGAGAEYDRLEPSNGARRSKSSPYINAGLGFQYDLNDRMAFQADVRQVHGFLRSGNQFGMSHVDNQYLTVGMNYYFGKK